MFLSDTQAFVNPVNCEGVTGAGLAKQSKRLFPLNFAAYADACKCGTLKLGTVLATVESLRGNDVCIINVPTKNTWQEKSSMIDVKRSVVAMLYQVSTFNLTSVSIPALGCGLGGLCWDEVREMLENGASLLPNVHFDLYVPMEP